MNKNRTITSSAKAKTIVECVRGDPNKTLAEILKKVKKAHGSGAGFEAISAIRKKTLSKMAKESRTVIEPPVRGEVHESHLSQDSKAVGKMAEELGIFSLTVLSPGKYKISYAPRTVILESHPVAVSNVSTVEIPANGVSDHLEGGV